MPDTLASDTGYFGVESTIAVGPSTQVLGGFPGGGGGVGGTVGVGVFGVLEKDIFN